MHPEAYPLARRIVTASGADVQALIGNGGALRTLKPTQFVDETFGLPTVTDILKELEKPGRDPRPAFKTATFADGVEKIGDLEPGMLLEGVVTNVAAFGAFVDVGVHQDGLVHVSALSNTFVKDPRDVVKSGDVVRVRVVEVDPARKRISLTMKLDDPASDRRAGDGSGAAGERPRDGQPRDSQPRDGQPRNGQPRDSQRREGQSRDGYSRGGRTGGGDRGRQGRPAGQQRQGNGGGGQSGVQGAFLGGAMADALRRAGLDKK